MAKEIKATLPEGYKFTGTHPAGIDGVTGLRYNLKTITAAHIDLMISRGSKIFEKTSTKPKATDAK